MEPNSISISSAVTVIASGFGHYSVIENGVQHDESPKINIDSSGYMFRYNPAAEPKFSLDSKAPTADYMDFIKSETRYARLMQSFPERANELFEHAEENAKAKYERLTKLGELYK